MLTRTESQIAQRLWVLYSLQRDAYNRGDDLEARGCGSRFDGIVEGLSYTLSRQSIGRIIDEVNRLNNTCCPERMRGHMMEGY